MTFEEFQALVEEFLLFTLAHVGPPTDAELDVAYATVETLTKGDDVP